MHVRGQRILVFEFLAAHGAGGVLHVGVHHPDVPVQVVRRDGLLALRARHVAVAATQGASPRHSSSRPAASWGSSTTARATHTGRQAASPRVQVRAAERPAVQTEVRDGRAVLEGA